MVFAILKLSYNNIGDTTLEGGICGSGFFIDSRTAITAHHVLNENTFQPNTGYGSCKLWILTRLGTVITLEKKHIAEFPEIDTSIIRIEKNGLTETIHPISKEDVGESGRVEGLGHTGNAMPSINANWGSVSLIIERVDLQSVMCDQQGVILRKANLSARSKDVNIENINGYEVSFGSKVGMSGGPLLNRDNREVLAMLSFGLPADAVEKTRTFAVAINEITRRLKSI